MRNITPQLLSFRLSYALAMGKIGKDGLTEICHNPMAATPVKSIDCVK